MPTGEAELPAVYHENVLCLMVQEPAVVFAYWDLSFGHVQAVREHKDLLLCLYKSSQLIHKINLPPFTNNWYFRNVEPGSEYFCELGFQIAGGTFFPLLRSNRVNTPGLAPAEEESAEAARVTVPDLAAPLSEQEKSYQVADLFDSLAFYMGFQPDK
ncbi:MAG: DUF4912 domain-containing protein [Bacillota bacterium]